jgi:hypothetical protein
MRRRRSERPSRVENLFSLIVEDAARAGIPTSDIPASELEQLSAFHAAALGDPPSLQPSAASGPPGAVAPRRQSAAAAAATALSPASSGAAVAAAAAPSASASAGGGGRPSGPAKLGRGFFVGKPVRLYDDLHDHFHTGRIVDTRRTHEDGIADVECLVRFAAGSDHRKEAGSYWIALEEHNLSVGTTLVYAKLPSAAAAAVAGRKSVGLKGRRSPTSSLASQAAVVTPARSAAGKDSRWVPAMVWLRSTRALLSLYGINPELKTLKNPAAKKNPKALWAAVRPFGSKEMVECELVRHAVDFSSPAAFGAARASGDGGGGGNGDDDDRLRFLDWLALAELHAQERVRRWHSLPLRNRRHPLALTSRDESALGPLVPANAELGPVVPAPGLSPRPLPHARLCPLVPPGLSRERLVQLMKQHRPEAAASFEPSKDAASTLAVRIVGLSSFETTLLQK